MTKYLKALVPGVATVIYAVYEAFGVILADNEITAAEWRNLAILAVTTFLTWLVPNKQPVPLPPPEPPA